MIRWIPRNSTSNTRNRYCTHIQSSVILLPFFSRNTQHCCSYLYICWELLILFCWYLFVFNQRTQSEMRRHGLSSQTKRKENDEQWNMAKRRKKTIFIYHMRNSINRENHTTLLRYATKYQLAIFEWQKIKMFHKILKYSHFTAQ